MSDLGPALPDDLGAMMRDFDRRLRDLERGEAGLSLPAPFASTATSVVVTSATFVPAWLATAENAPGEVFVIESGFLVLASTLEVKLVETISGNESDVLTISASFFNYWRWEWEHGIDLGPDSRLNVQIQARRTAGSTTTMYQPTLSIMRPKLEVPGAVPGGNPTAI